MWLSSRAGGLWSRHESLLRSDDPAQGKDIPATEVVSRGSATGEVHRICTDVLVPHQQAHHIQKEFICTDVGKNYRCFDLAVLFTEILKKTPFQSGVCELILDLQKKVT